MSSQGLEAIDQTVQKTHLWINEVAEELGTDDKHRAFGALRATLHALRDHLVVDESAQFAGQLPLLLRGVYYEGWDPSKTPLKERDLELFTIRVGEAMRMDRVDNAPEPAEAAKASGRVIARHVTEGEVQDVLGSLPGPVRELFGSAMESRKSA